MGKKTNLKTWLVISVFLLALAGPAAAGAVIYVDADASLGGNGTSWATAYKYLQDALYEPPSGGDQIWVAAGTYKPDEDEGANVTPNDRTATFQLINGVGIYGGFAGTETTLAQRNWQTNETILSGDLNGDDGPGQWQNNSENSYHVVVGSGTNATAILDGFTITAGNANGASYPQDCGGGMLNDNGSPTVTHCTFSGNWANQGGGMYNDGGSPTVSNCTFSSNSAGDDAGGMYNNNYSSPTLTNCTFSGNSATGMLAPGSGGGIYCYWFSSPTLSNCTLSGNTADHSGGGISYYANCSATLTNCTVSGNTAGSCAGGIYCLGSDPTLINCTISGNTADNGGGIFCYQRSNPTVTNCTFSGNHVSVSGGGIYCVYYSNLTVTNCTFAANSATNGNALACDSASQSYPSNVQLANCILWDGGGEIWNNDGSTITITYSDVQGGWGGPGSNNIDADPMFFDANNPDPNLRDYHLRPGSPCIDAGDNTALPADTADLDGDGNTTEPLPFDIDTDVRVSGGVVDMGSDEAIWASDQDVDQGEEVILNPGGGGTDPNTEALVVFENVSGPNDATIEVTEVGTDLYPDGLFRALGTTIRIDTSLADGEFFITVSIPFDANDLAGEDPFGVDLMYWDAVQGKWRHAVWANTDPQQSNPKWIKDNRWLEEYPTTPAPTLADMKARGMGANGVFWNSQEDRGFVWANVDHTTDFEGLAHNIADFEPDGDVDFVDFAWFAPNWMDTGCGTCSGADLTYDGNVGLDDLRKFTDNWLLGVE